MALKRSLVSEINVTPFVDVMLVLLIIFMVATPMLTQGLDVDLPVTSQAQNLPIEQESLLLSVKADGTLYLGEKQILLSEIDLRLQALTLAQKERLFLQADRNVAYGLVVDIMGRAKAAGIDKLAVIATKPQES